MEKYPHLYSDMYGPIDKTCMHWGLCISSGWYDILRRTSEKIEAVILSLPEDQRHLYKFAQVKEKFGLIRIYFSVSNDQINEIITQAEKESETTCESCGAEGKFQYKTNWFIVNCDKCYSEYLTKRGIKT